MINYLNKEVNLADYTVIVPSVGVGNVAQLAADLLISTLKMEKVATVWHPAIIPIVGPNAFQHDVAKNKITISCELYVSVDRKLATLQIRSPLVAAKMNDFFGQLLVEFSRHKIAKLLILTSGHAFEKHIVESAPFEFVANDRCDQTELSEMNWIQFNGDVIHGGGYAKKLWTLATEQQIASIILFKYCSEGDNTPDATQLVDQLNRLLNVLPKDANGHIQLAVPISWKLLFGNAPPKQLY